MHRWTFNEEFSGIQPINAVVHDDVSNTDEEVSRGVRVSGGKAVFQWEGRGSSVPYIKLPYASLSPGRVVTIETWVTFDSSNNASATLFSFGQGVSAVSFQSGVSGQYVSVYLTVVFNSVLGYAKEHVNGVLISETPLSLLPSAFLNGPNSHDVFGYIGRNYLGNGPGLSAAIDEFRIWYGELSPAVIYKNYIVGVDPSHVTLSTKVTISNVNITFIAISTQAVNIGFYGGASQYPMFGSETSFMVAAADPQCAYSVVLPLNSQTSSVRANLAAMSYVVSLYKSKTPAPVFSSAACDPTNPLEACSVGGVFLRRI